ncbi:MAG: acyl-CoA dehydrogenase family protein [Actinomycetota bacterium]|nr:acyl-CoA dehydrogenase family protein [Actinomycetota bacterium]
MGAAGRTPHRGRGVYRHSRGNLAASVEYSRERVQFGKLIIQNQAIACRIADLATELESVKSLTYLTAWRYDKGEYPVKEISMAKLKSTIAAFEVCDEALQIMGVIAT